ncbi:MAG: peptidoglycan-binding protein [Thermaerobacter sp.]|jgi:flagellar protein FlgJ|nr:peptidoglycan-binding protein [Thermaerobacter sp.]
MQREGCTVHLQTGAAGTEVVRIQKLLIGLGYLAPPADGRFGPLTAEAVRVFQGQLGLGSDGSVDDATYQRLVIQYLLPDAMRMEVASLVPAGPAVAVAILETGWLAQVPRDAATGASSHNLFGIKWTADCGLPYVEETTREYLQGAWETVTARFCAYRDDAAAFTAFADLVRTPRYAAAFARRSDSVAFLQGLAEGGYATDPQYAAKLLSIMEQHPSLYTHAASPGTPLPGSIPYWARRAVVAAVGRGLVTTLDLDYDQCWALTLLDRLGRLR